jgi:hypothetical protein
MVTGDWAASCIVQEWDYDYTEDIPTYNQSQGLKASVSPLPGNAAFAWPVILAY